MVYTLRFFFLQNAVCFIILTYLVPILFTFYIQSVLKLKKKSGVKRLIQILSRSKRKHFFYRIASHARNQNSSFVESRHGY